MKDAFVLMDMFVFYLLIKTSFSGNSIDTIYCRFNLKMLIDFPRETRSYVLALLLNEISGLELHEKGQTNAEPIRTRSEPKS